MAQKLRVYTCNTNRVASASFGSPVIRLGGREQIKHSPSSQNTNQRLKGDQFLFFIPALLCRSNFRPAQSTYKCYCLKRTWLEHRISLPYTNPQISRTSISAIIPMITMLKALALIRLVSRIPIGTNIITGIIASRPCTMRSSS